MNRGTERLRHQCMINAPVLVTLPDALHKR